MVHGYYMLRFAQIGLGIVSVISLVMLISGNRGATAPTLFAASMIMAIESLIKGKE